MNNDYACINHYWNYVLDYKPIIGWWHSTLYAGSIASGRMKEQDPYEQKIVACLQNAALRHQYTNIRNSNQSISVKEQRVCVCVFKA